MTLVTYCCCCGFPIEARCKGCGSTHHIDMKTATYAVLIDVASSQHFSDEPQPSQDESCPQIQSSQG